MILYVSTGAETVTVPDVVGTQLDAARTTLEGAGFTVTVTQKEDAKADVGTVLSQSPGGRHLGRQGLGGGTRRGQGAGAIAVPNVVGQDEATAIDTLTKAGFDVNEQQVDVTDEGQDGTVVQQDPSGGKAKPGSTVTIGVGSFTPPPNQHLAPAGATP